MGSTAGEPNDASPNRLQPRTGPASLEGIECSPGLGGRSAVDPTGVTTHFPRIHSTQGSDAMKTNLPSLSNVASILGLGLALIGADLLGAGGNAVAQVPGVSREQMWYAPTAEDWKKPVHLTFQRTWEDALAVAKETGQPILACINMDGEIASEHYAGIRYRDPEIAKLYEPYVCVIASVYRHTPRDHDEEGKRILCPRFGSVTCGEHIAIEPILFEKYLDGNRVAPRHIMIELDGSEVYDMYYARDTDSVFRQIRDGVADRQNPIPPIVRGDRPILERVASHHVEDRDAVERAYEDGDEQLRRQILEAAMEHADVVSADLLRLAVFGLDTDMAALAREALAKSQDEDAIELIPEALKGSIPEEERKKLLAALERLGEKTDSERARWLSNVHRGLATRSQAVDVDGWSGAFAGSSYPAPQEEASWMDLEKSIDETAERIAANPEDAEAYRTLAEDALAYALEADQAFGIEPTTTELMTADPRTARRMARSKYYEAREAAARAGELGLDDWRTEAVLALANYYLDAKDEAFELAASSVGKIPPGETEWNAMAVLTIFAEGRFRAIKKAIEAGKRWDPRWLTDVNSAYAVLLRHPEGTAGQVAWHHDFLVWLGARRNARQVVEQGLVRFPSSPKLHEQLRTRLLEGRGVAALEPAYRSLLKRAAEGDDPAAAEATATTLRWFAGLASLVAAEHHRRGNDPEAASGAYDRALESWSTYLEGVGLDAAGGEDPATDHNVALALAGKARLAFEAKDYTAAMELCLESFERSRESAGTLDGLSHTPASTAQQVLAKLVEADRREEAERLRSALRELDPADLREPFTSN